MQDLISFDSIAWAAFQHMLTVTDTGAQNLFDNTLL
jgi:hypothetical protein